MFQATPSHADAARSGSLSTRFALPQREVDGDWLDAMEDVDGGPPLLRTSVTEKRRANHLAQQIARCAV
jgi:hypothetical protein